jgi:CDP-diglyceride synthetase
MMPMTNGQTLNNLNQERVWRWGCGCLGMVTCLVLLLILLAFVGILMFGLLFTAPPLEFMSQMNDFLENELGWIVIVLAVFAVAVGGFVGSFVGKLISNARSKAQSNI